VTGDDYARLGDGAAELAIFLGNQAFMKIEHGHCIALVIDPSNSAFRCKIYDRRPAVCRDLERGSPACEGERATKGDRPLIALQRKRRS
jgi:uncharacterized protein